MKWNSIKLLVIISIVCQYSYGQDFVRLKDWGIPVAGEKLNVDYQAVGGPLAGEKHISGIIYLFNDYKWFADDILLKEKNGHWEGQYKLPENCAFIAVKFVATDKGQQVGADNNDDKGFIATTVDRQQQPLPGNYLAWAIFRKPSFGKAPSGYFNKFEISDQALELWVRKELQFFPRKMPKYFDSYLGMLKLSKPDSFPKLALKGIHRFAQFPDLGEQGYQKIYDAYNYNLKDKEKTDSMKKVILTKFPNGNLGRLTAYNSAYGMAMNDNKILALEKFLRDYPIATYRKTGDGSQNFTYYNVYRMLAAAYFAMNNNEKLFAMVPDMDFSTLNENYRWNIDRTFELNRLPLDRIYPVSHVLIDELIKKKGDRSYMDGARYTPLQADDAARFQLDNKLSIHIRLLNKMERYTEALPYLKQLSDVGMYAEANLNEAHANILEHTGGEKNVQAVLEKGVHANAATPVMIEKLKVIYQQKHGDIKGFEAYLEGIRPVNEKKIAMARLKSELINIRLSDFSLENLTGQIVNSADWKDKIIVIDFWATWCYPCKMAFPGMQQLVDRYAKDNKVGVYFISTMEKKENYKEEVKKYIQSSGYRFNVLFDSKIGTEEQNDQVFKSMVPLFKSSAIPRKIVIKNGMIRYTSEGYGGSPSKLLDELSYVIEILKTE